MSISTETGQFIAHPDKDPVSFILDQPEYPVAVFVLGHGAGAGMDHPHMESLARMLISLNFSVFRYQFPFRERGGGRDSQKVSLSTVQQAVKKASELAPGLSVWAGGHSFGGRMTTTAASEGMLQTVENLVLFSWPLHAPGRPGIDRAAHLKEIWVPMLFLSGDRDTFVQHDQWVPVIEGLGQAATLVWIKGADHGWKTRKRDTEAIPDVYSFAAEMIQSWSSRGDHLRIGSAV